MVGSGYILNKIRVGRLFTFFENFFYLEYSDLLGTDIKGSIFEDLPLF